MSIDLSEIVKNVMLKSYDVSNKEIGTKERRLSTIDFFDYMADKGFIIMNRSIPLRKELSQKIGEFACSCPEVATTLSPKTLAFVRNYTALFENENV